MKNPHPPTTEKPDELSLAELAVETYAATVSSAIQQKIDYEIRQAFLTGVQFGLKTAQEIYKS
jgi:hypothetical protein